MKRLLIALSIVALNGCALYDAYMMTGYDPNEYRIITEIRTDATIVYPFPAADHSVLWQHQSPDRQFKDQRDGSGLGSGQNSGGPS